jgi:hypothetical protein
MTTTVHVSTSFENAAMARAVMRTLEENGFFIARDWTALDHAAQLDRLRETERTFQRADVLVILLPAGRSTHVELGMAIARGLPVVLCAPNGPDWLRNEKDGRVCSYYRHPAVRITYRLEEIVELVRWRGAEAPLDGKGSNR